MRRALICAGLLLLVAAGFGWWLRPTHPPVVNRSIYETDMVENLVRRLLTELQPPVEPVCFLAFGDGTTPPSRAFIARFAGTTPEVLSCGAGAMPPGGRQFETSTGRPGLTLHIVEFKEIQRDMFDVLVRFSNLPEGHNGFTYRVLKVGYEWKVNRRKAA